MRAESYAGLAGVAAQFAWSSSRHCKHSRCHEKSNETFKKTAKIGVLLVNDHLHTEYKIVINIALRKDNP